MNANQCVVIVKWGNKEFPVEVDPENCIGEFKRKIQDLTNVVPKRQKLLGIKYSGKHVLDDEVLVKELNLKHNQKIMMMGTVEEKISEMAAPPPVDSEVVDDFDTTIEEIDVAKHPDNLRKIQNRVEKLQITMLNQPREGKKLLVLDVDYTLMDHKSSVERAEELMRPHLHRFLTSAYEHFDIIIWSATSMRWIELKMKELGVADNPNFKITCYLDHAAMITVNSPKYGVYDTKPLGVIWGKFPDIYKKSATIMLDDLGRNFIMNPQQGLKIRPFRNAPMNRHIDTELLLIGDYLTLIKELNDFSELDHGEWEHYVKQYKRNGL